MEVVETPEAAAARELHEESGLAAPRTWQYLGSVGYRARDGALTIRHYLLAVMDLPQGAWTHIVRSGDEGDRWVCHYFCQDLRPDFLRELGGRLGAGLDALLRALGEPAPCGRT